jgi:hypothetical protein
MPFLTPIIGRGYQSRHSALKTPYFRFKGRFEAEASALCNFRFGPNVPLWERYIASIMPVKIFSFKHSFTPNFNQSAHAFWVCKGIKTSNFPVCIRGKYLIWLDGINLLTRSGSSCIR